MEEEKKQSEKKPASIVLEVQSVRHVVNLQLKPRQMKKENENHG